MATRRDASRNRLDSQKGGPLTKMTMFFFRRPLVTGLLWLAMLVFGVFSYTTLLNREGFPSVNIPITIVNGGYFVDDAEKVDTDIGRPFSDAVLQFEGVTSVQTQSQANFFTAVVNYREGVDSQSSAAELEALVNERVDLPPSVSLRYNAPYFGVTGGDTEKLDVAVSFFGTQSSEVKTLTTAAQSAVDVLNQRPSAVADRYFVQQQFSEAVDPMTGQITQRQLSFDRTGVRTDSGVLFYDSVIIGVSGVENFDVLELDAEVRSALHEIMDLPEFSGYRAEVTASFAPSITESISELQRVLLEGLLAVLVVGSLIIAIRASFITVISMVSVIAITLGLLFVTGYTLNVITLFALILGLSLIVDDTIIMIEALDVSRKRNKNPDATVSSATTKISRAMVAATTTAALSFAPLLFVSGVLGSFIRAIPFTIISALAISLIVALVFIPFFARFLMLRKKHMGTPVTKELGASVEARIARFLMMPMNWARNSRKKLVLVVLIAVCVGVGFIGAAGGIARNVEFNIFPQSKDSNGVIVTLSFPPDVSLSEAQLIAERAESVIVDAIGEEFEHASYFNSGTTSGARIVVTISPYAERSITAPQLVAQLKKQFDNFDRATVQVSQEDVGPPASDFTVRVDSTSDREAAFALAQDVAQYLEETKLVRANGEQASIRAVSVTSPNTFIRIDGKLSIDVTASFEDADTSTLVTLSRSAVEAEFTPEKIASFGLSDGVISFDFGQESENQDSFQTLVLAFPVVLFVIYALLAFQFRSLLQPALIFLAIPFSLFGVTLGLYLTDNALSFFSMLGFFALIGLSIKNTILLVDYANQARRAGMGAIDAAMEALSERFRPLVATSLTAIVSLIPLAIVSPFWQGLAVTLIFGLFSSTLLVLTVFPYYYLGSEYARQTIGRTTGIVWSGLSLIFGIGMTILVSPLFLLLSPAIIALVMWIFVRKRR